LQINGLRAAVQRARYWRSAGSPDRTGVLRRQLCGGPPASPPKRSGYGSKLITSIISFTLEGKQEQTFGPEGFSIDLFIPLAAMDVPVTADPSESESNHANNGAGG
jgi:hypothetical protein